MKKVVLNLLLLVIAAPAVFAGDNPRVNINTNLGSIVVELEREKAPATVENFLKYVNDGFYNGTIFHRVINGFMIQGGGFTADFSQKETRPPIQNEADNGLKNEIGTIAMARTGDPNSATAQFFINVAANDFLDHTAPTIEGWGYAVFGRVVSGMDVVDQIKNTPTASGGPFPKDVPETPVVIKEITQLATTEEPSHESKTDDQ